MMAGNSAKHRLREGLAMPSFESSMQNLAKARSKWCPPRPWRSPDESRLIRRYAFLWFTSRGKRPSGRDWARQLGISHTWLQKLVRKFQADPTEMYRDVKLRGNPIYTDLIRAQERTRQMNENGELRGSRLADIVKFLERDR